MISVVYSTLGHGPKRSHSTRPSLDALHLITSTRLLGWTGGLPIQYDPYPEFPPKTDPSKPESKLSQQEVNSKAIRVHGRYVLIHWALIDLLTFAFHTLGRRGIGSPRGGSIYAAADSVVACAHQHLPFLFRTSYAPAITWIIRQGHLVLVHFATGIAFYQGLCLGYHLAALGGLVIFRQDAGQWPRLMRQPLMADSLLQFWGKRWHQVSGLRLSVSRLADPLFADLPGTSSNCWHFFRVLTSHFSSASIRRTFAAATQALSIPR